MLKRSTLAGLALAVGACQGQLMMTTGQASAMDMSAPMDLAPATISYADIDADLNMVSLGCSLASTACHGPGNPNNFTIIAGAGNNQSTLMTNYQQVLLQVNLKMPAESLLLNRPLMGGAQFDMGTHPGGTPFASTSNAFYQQWLLWIQLGAHFQAVPISGGGSGSDMAMGSQPMDAAVTDAANGGG